MWSRLSLIITQTCNLCGERGVRVEKEADFSETKGGEFFYCPKCQIHLHTDVNAARNIVKIKIEFSAISGWTM